MKVHYETLGAIVMLKRIMKGMSREVLAKKAGVSVGVMKRIEMGARIPEEATIEMMERELGMKAGRLEQASKAINPISKEYQEFTDIILMFRASTIELIRGLAELTEAQRAPDETLRALLTKLGMGLGLGPDEIEMHDN